MFRRLSRTKKDDDDVIVIVDHEDNEEEEEVYEKNQDDAENSYAEDPNLTSDYVVEYIEDEGLEQVFPDDTGGNDDNQVSEHNHGSPSKKKRRSKSKKKKKKSKKNKKKKKDKGAISDKEDNSENEQQADDGPLITDDEMGDQFSNEGRPEHYDDLLTAAKYMSNDTLDRMVEERSRYSRYTAADDDDVNQLRGDDKYTTGASQSQGYGDNDDESDPARWRSWDAEDAEDKAFDNIADSSMKNKPATPPARLRRARGQEDSPSSGKKSLRDRKLGAVSDENVDESRTPFARSFSDTSSLTDPLNPKKLYEKKLLEQLQNLKAGEDGEIMKQPVVPPEFVETHKKGLETLNDLVEEEAKLRSMLRKTKSTHDEIERAGEGEPSALDKVEEIEEQKREIEDQEPELYEQRKQQKKRSSAPHPQSSREEQILSAKPLTKQKSKKSSIPRIRMSLSPVIFGGNKGAEEDDADDGGDEYEQIKPQRLQSKSDASRRQTALGQDKHGSQRSNINSADEREAEVDAQDGTDGKNNELNEKGGSDGSMERSKSQAPLVSDTTSNEKSKRTNRWPSRTKKNNRNSALQILSPMFASRKPPKAPFTSSAPENSKRKEANLARNEDGEGEEKEQMKDSTIVSSSKRTSRDEGETRKGSGYENLSQDVEQEKDIVQSHSSGGSANSKTGRGQAAEKLKSNSQHKSSSSPLTLQSPSTIVATRSLNMASKRGVPAPLVTTVTSSEDNYHEMGQEEKSVKSNGSGQSFAANNNIVNSQVTKVTEDDSASTIPARNSIAPGDQVAPGTGTQLTSDQQPGKTTISNADIKMMYTKSLVAATDSFNSSQISTAKNGSLEQTTPKYRLASAREDKELTARKPISPERRYELQPAELDEFVIPVTIQDDTPLVQCLKFYNLKTAASVAGVLISATDCRRSNNATHEEYEMRMLGQGSASISEKRKITANTPKVEVVLQPNPALQLAKSNDEDRLNRTVASEDSTQDAPEIAPAKSYVREVTGLRFQLEQNWEEKRAEQSALLLAKKLASENMSITSIEIPTMDTGKSLIASHSSDDSDVDNGAPATDAREATNETREVNEAVPEVVPPVNTTSMIDTGKPELAEVEKHEDSGKGISKGVKKGRRSLFPLFGRKIRFDDSQNRVLTE